LWGQEEKLATALPNPLSSLSLVPSNQQPPFREENMEIRGFIENSLLEWEGRLSCVVFVPGCNLRCRFCHAGHLLGPTCLESIAETQILRYMQRQAGWLDGVVITGGEPTLHEQDLIDFTGRVHEVGLEVMVETNGTRPRWVRRLIAGSHADAISMDVKAPLTPEDYTRVADAEVDIEALHTSIPTIIESGIPHEFRITVVPGLIGQEEVRLIAPSLEGAQHIAVQNFQAEHTLDKSLASTLPYRPEQMDQIAEELDPTGARITIRGRDRGLIARSDREAG
jgi:pyruvate formate lyase activating enzyme